MNENMITGYLLQFCYHCQDAVMCETEAKCAACFEKDGLIAQAEPEEITTEQLLRMYAY